MCRESVGRNASRRSPRATVCPSSCADTDNTARGTSIHRAGAISSLRVFSPRVSHLGRQTAYHRHRRRASKKNVGSPFDREIFIVRELRLIGNLEMTRFLFSSVEDYRDFRSLSLNGVFSDVTSNFKVVLVSRFTGLIDRVVGKF